MKRADVTLFDWAAVVIVAGVSIFAWELLWVVVDVYTMEHAMCVALPVQGCAP